MPYFSVLVPTYNQAGYLADAFASLFAQTDPRWEAVVVDDGSTDDTPEALRQLARQDQRIRVLRQSNGGVGAALNTALQNATAPWICWLSTDDWFEPDKLAVHASAIAQRPDLKFFYTDFHTFDEETKTKTPVKCSPFSVQFQPLRYLQANPIAGNSVCVHRSVFSRVGLFREHLRNGQDFDLWLRASANFKMGHIGVHTCTSRWHSAMGTVQFPEAGIFDSARACIDFLNNTSFPDILPLLDLEQPRYLQLALIQTLRCLANPHAFMYQGVGFNTALLDRLLEWTVADLSPQTRGPLLQGLIASLAGLLSEGVPEDLLQMMRQTVARCSGPGVGAAAFQPYDSLEMLRKNRERLARCGDNQAAEKIDKYLTGFAREAFLSARRALPLRHSATLSRGGQVVHALENVRTKIEDLTLLDLAFSCRQVNGKRFTCDTRVALSQGFDDLPVRNPTNTGVQELSIGPALYDALGAGYDFVAARQAFERATNMQGSTFKASVAFTLIAADVAGGGTANVLRYATWLQELGVAVTVYSDRPKPAWVESALKFAVLADPIARYAAIVEHIVIVYSITELPAVLQTPGMSERVVYHFCQGVETFHYGDYRRPEQRPFFDLLHSLPVGRITASGHVNCYFQENFGQQGLQVTNGIDTAVFNAEPKLTLGDPIRVLFIGIPSHTLKGLNCVRDAIERLAAKGDGRKWQLTIVSGAPPAEGWRLDELSPWFSVEEHYRLSPEKVREQYALADVYVNASWYEGFGLSSLEAMACGVPVVQAKNGGLDDVLTDEVDCLKFVPGDSADMAQCLARIVNEPATRQRLITAAKRTAASFDRTRQRSEFLEVFSRVLARPLEPKQQSLAVNQTSVRGNKGVAA